MTDEDHAKHLAMQERFERMSDEWRARGNTPAHHEEARLDPLEQKKEMDQAKAEMRHLLGGRYDNADERMTAALIATRGRPVGSRTLADEMSKEAGNRRASMYAAAAGLSGMMR